MTVSMKQKNHQTAIAAKLKKWVETIKQLNTQNIVLALPITRLTSIKSLCQDEAAAQKFALFIAKQVLQQIDSAALKTLTNANIFFLIRPRGVGTL